MTPKKARRRLLTVFGQHGANIIVERQDKLDSIFGLEAAIIIRLEMLGENEHG